MSAPKKVAVLGGGASALVAAFELTRPELAGQYDVTVYQMGWRLGGKGASGRNRAIGQRIEEHGLHIWMGFYDNAFSVMQEAYAEVNRPGGPLRTWRDALKEHSYIVLEEPFAGGWQPWQLVFPPNPCTPGLGEEPGVWELAVMILRWARGMLEASPIATHATSGVAAPVIPPEHEACILDARGRGPAPAPRRNIGCVAALERELAPAVEAGEDHVRGLLDHAHAIAASIPHDSRPTPIQAGCIVWLLESLMGLAWSILEGAVATSFPAFRLWVSLNLAGSAICGILKDDVPTAGWDSIDDVELRAWLGRHGANAATLGSSPVRAVSDLAVGYVGGATKDGRFAAGTAMRGMLRMLFTYKGAIFYKMQAGMGDTVFTPLYSVLAGRGVKFRFFHRVDALHVDPETKLVESIDLTEQARPVGEGYEPLVDVEGLPCWPSEPLYEQLEHGTELQATGINLESAWAPRWERSGAKTLRRGDDFDLVVLGISIGAFPYVAKELIANNPRFGAMVEKVQTVETCAFQLWLKPDLAGLGWKSPFGVTEPPVVGAFVEPLDTWADMSHLLPREAWPGAAPQSVAYFCGPFEERGAPPPFDAHDFPARELGRLDGMARDFLRRDVRALWPATANGDDFRWDLLVDLEERGGEARFASQFRRVNIDPSERYVLSVPGSTSFRLAAGESGFANVFLAGDWTRCGLNAGCVEAAVTSGLLAANAITGRGRRVAWANAL